MPVIFEAPKKKDSQKFRKREILFGKQITKTEKKLERAIEGKIDKVVSRNPLSAFLVRPPDVRFAAQEKKEEIILLLRRHPVTNLPWVVSLMLLLFVPSFLFPILTFLKIIPPMLPSPFKLIGFLFWYLACFGFFLVNFLLWYFNVNIVTDKRIIDIDFIYLLYEETTITRITQVEDVTYKMGGIARTIFNFGDVFVHTAGPEQNIEFLGVPKPAEVVKTIIKLIGKKR